MSDEFQESWNKLQESYLLSVPERIKELDDLWQLSHVEHDQLEHLHRKAHSLAGSGAIYGLPELSRQAKKLELYVQGLIGDGLLPDERQSLQFDMHMLSVRGAAEQGVLAKTDGAHDGEQLPTDLQALLGTRKIEILVAEDDLDSRAQLVLILQRLGHKVVEAGDGSAAVDAFIHKRPDLVLMDINMPVMDGYEAARKIKALCGENFIPIIFLTAATDEKSMMKAIEAGGDDFLIKPYNGMVLHAKIHAMQRIESLNRELASYKIRTEEEVQLARHVYNAITERNDDTLTGLSFWREAAGHFSGDIVFYRRGLDDLHYVFVGDFTGHGMGAALGGLVAADVFHVLLEKGATPGEIVSELNRKLNTVLPTGRYCAGCMLAFDEEERSLSIWNCGLPAALLKGKGEVVEFASKNLPLGVMYSENVFFDSEEVHLPEGDSIVVYSDGISEAINGKEELYGEDRLTGLIASSNNQGEDLLFEIKADVLEYISDGDLLDDVTLMVMKP